MKTNELIMELKKNHKTELENMSIEQYENEGDEEFFEWLKTQCYKVEE